MANSYKILGQVAPANTNNTDLYTVPASTQTIVSTLHITNVTSTATAARVYIRKTGAAAALSNAFVYDFQIPANDVRGMTEGITLSAGDIITVRSGVATALTFHLFGSEVV
jgi:hypothetical protein